MEWKKRCSLSKPLTLISASLKFLLIEGGSGWSSVRSLELFVCLASRTLVHWELFLLALPLTDVALGKDLQQISEHQGKRRHLARIFPLQTQCLQMQLWSAGCPSAQSLTLAYPVLLETGRGLSQGNLHFKMEFFKAPQNLQCAKERERGTEGGHFKPDGKEREDNIASSSPFLSSQSQETSWVNLKMSHWKWFGAEF